MKSLDTTSKSGKAALDAAVKACSSFGNLKSVVTQLISDCKSATSTETFLKEKCGIILDNADTGAITGKDAGGSKTKTAESIVPESGKASYPSGTSFTKRGLKVIVPKKNTLTTAQQIVIQGLYSWWIDSALNLIEQSYGYSFTDNDATVKKITLKFVDKPDSDILAYVEPNLSSTDGSTYKADALTLTINMSRFNNITADEINGSEETAPFYLDRVIAHELTHALMAAKIDNFQDMPTFITEGIAELTHGIDDTRASDIEKLAANPSQLKTILNANSEPSNLDYAAGYIFLRYLAKQVSEGNNTIPAVADDEFIENTVAGATIQTSSGNDTISNSAEKVTINAGDGDDEINNS
ncbi:MAG: hypothetical protein IJP68_03400, partial [Selenomonadaceae bacterium]|nr:hypothetical protein [Selenomonadaceae bacterium]